MDLKPGSRWRSRVGTAEFVVVRSPKVLGVLKSGGYPLGSIGSEPAELIPVHPELAEELSIGKRYTDGLSGLELLVSKGGLGTLTFDDRKLTQKEAKGLPSSD